MRLAHRDVFVAALIAVAATASSACGAPRSPATSPAASCSGPTAASSSSAPPTSAPPTTAVPTSALPTSAPPTSAPPTSALPTSAPPTSAPQTSAPPTPAPPAVADWLLGREWDAIPTTRKVVALTFDAGANDAGLAAVLRTLAAEHVPATFFLTGDWARTYPAAARRIAAGYRVGDHSITHPHFTRLSDRQIREQVQGAATVLRRICGVDPAPLFRFPFGDRDARTIGVVNSVGYVPVGWTVDTLGWQGTGAGITADVVVHRVLSAARPGEIVLMHVGANPDDHSTLDADALPRLVARLHAQGYAFVTLDALLSR